MKNSKKKKNRKSLFSKLLLAASMPFIAGAILSLLSPAANPAVFYPKTHKDMKKVSVMVVGAKSGGSGVIYRSSDNGSDILTNRHVCEATKKKGGLVILEERRYEVQAIKPSNMHDLCMVHVKENLHINTAISDKAPEFGDRIVVSGYPLLQPLVIVHGHLGDPIQTDPPAVMVTVMVQHGNSGSPVFNSKGEIVAVIFAFSGRSVDVGYGYAVPHRYVKAFVDRESKRLPWTEVPHVRRS